MPYYLVRVLNIKEAGQTLNASSEKDTWFRDLIKDSLSKEVKNLDATLTANLQRNDKSIEVVGGVYIKADMECDLCLATYALEEQIPFRLILEPKATGSVEADDDEDINDSMDFSYYSGDEIDIGDIVRQHILMAQPITYLCKESCKGLCNKCGKDVAESPFSVLKDLKPIDKS